MNLDPLDPSVDSLLLLLLQVLPLDDGRVEDAVTQSKPAGEAKSLWYLVKDSSVVPKWTPSENGNKLTLDGISRYASDDLFIAHRHCELAKQPCANLYSKQNSHWLVKR